MVMVLLLLLSALCMLIGDQQLIKHASSKKLINPATFKSKLRLQQETKCHIKCQSKFSFCSLQYVSALSRPRTAINDKNEEIRYFPILHLPSISCQFFTIAVIAENSVLQHFLHHITLANKKVAHTYIRPEFNLHISYY